MNRIHYSTGSTEAQMGLFPLTIQTMECIEQQIRTLANLARIGGNNYSLRDEQGNLSCVVWDGEPLRVEQGSNLATHFALISRKESILSDRGTFENVRELRWVKPITVAEISNYQTVRPISEFPEVLSDIVRSNDPRLSNARQPLQHNHNASEITAGVLSVARGGTGATTAVAARTSLGLAAVASSGNYNDLSNRPAIPVQESGTWTARGSGGVNAIIPNAVGTWHRIGRRVHCYVRIGGTDILGNVSIQGMPFTQRAGSVSAFFGQMDNHDGAIVPLAFRMQNNVIHSVTNLPRCDYEFHLDFNYETS